MQVLPYHKAVKMCSKMVHVMISQEMSCKIMQERSRQYYSMLALQQALHCIQSDMKQIELSLEYQASSTFSLMRWHVLTCRALCKLSALLSQHSQDQETDPQQSFALKFYLPGIKKSQSNAIHCKHERMILNHAVSIITYKQQSNTAPLPILVHELCTSLQLFSLVQQNPWGSRT